MDENLETEFTGFIYGTWKYGKKAGPYLRQPFWRSYTEFYELWQILSERYSVELPFPENRSMFGKISWKRGTRDRRKVLESFLRHCLRISEIWKDPDWNQFINPLRLPVQQYFPNNYMELGLIEWSQNVNVYRVRANFREYAVKSIGLAKSFHPQLLNEVMIHQKLDYKHCLKFYGYQFENSRILNQARLNLVLEVAKQSLLQALEQDVAKDGFTESKAREIFYQIMLGVLYLHHHGICHRDLKPQNILLMRDETVKICDYGFAYYQGALTPDQSKDRQNKTSRPDLDIWQHFQANLVENSPLPVASCGTYFYVAPEVLNSEGYDGQKADLYSCGRILFRLLAGIRPFNAETFASFSTRAQDLVMLLLEEDPKNRPLLPEIFEHPWLNPTVKKTELLSVLQSELKYGAFSPETSDVIHEMGKYTQMDRVERQIYLTSNNSRYKRLFSFVGNKAKK